MAALVATYFMSVMWSIPSISNYVKALYMKNKACVGPWSSGWSCMLKSEHVLKHNVRFCCFPFCLCQFLGLMGNYAWLWTEMLDRSFLMISLTVKKEKKERERGRSGDYLHSLIEHFVLVCFVLLLCVSMALKTINLYNCIDVFNQCGWNFLSRTESVISSEST